MLCVDKQYGVVNKTQHLEVKPSITWEVGTQGIKEPAMDI